MQWYEIWNDYTHDIPYLLILIMSKEEKYIIVDPKEGNKIVFESTNYRDAKYWLLEDEFTLVKGRMLHDE